MALFWGGYGMEDRSSPGSPDLDASSRAEANSIYNKKSTVCRAICRGDFSREWAEVGFPRGGRGRFWGNGFFWAKSGKFRRKTGVFPTKGASFRAKSVILRVRSHSLHAKGSIFSAGIPSLHAKSSPWRSRSLSLQPKGAIFCATP